LEIRLDGEAEFAELIAVGNEQYSSSGTHLGLDWTVERVAGKKTLSEYMDYYNEYMTDESYSGGVFRLQESGRVEINGRVWERRVYTIDESEPYYVLCLVTEVKNGFFLSVSATYWPENERAEEQVLEHVEKQLQISR
jgi:hypothetical protein